MVTSMNSDLLMRTWDMQLTVSVGNLHITDHYITGIIAIYIHCIKLVYTCMFHWCVCVCHIIDPHSTGLDGKPGTFLSTQLQDTQQFLTFSYSKVQLVCALCVPLHVFTLHMVQ